MPLSRPARRKYERVSQRDFDAGPEEDQAEDDELVRPRPPRAMSSLTASLTGSSDGDVERTASSARNEHTGEKLLPNVVEVNQPRRLMHQAFLFFFGTLELGLLTLGYDLGTQMDATDGALAANDGADGAKAAAQMAEHQAQINEQQTLGHEKARACIGVGIVGIALTLATAASRGELQRYLRRACGSERKLSRTLGHMIEIVYVTACVCFPFMVYLTFFVLEMRPHDVAWIVASIFTMMTVALSGREIRKHLENYSSPRVQKHIIRILWMPPVYAVDCFMAMRFDSIGVYLTVLREMYEAYCVWSFMALMIEFLHNVATLRRGAASKELHSAEEAATLDGEFARFDSNGDGFIDLDELGAVFQALHINLTRPELQDVMGSFDEDGDGRLERHEFVQIMALKMTDHDVREAFDALDKDSSGTLYPAEFSEVAMNMGFDEGETQELIAIATGGSDSTEITREQFETILRDSPVFRVRIGILQRVGALWALARANQGNHDASDIRYRDVASMLEQAADEARAKAAADPAGGAHGHGHGDDGDGTGCCQPAPCDVGEHPHMPPFHKARPWKQGIEFLHKCRVGVLQYVACQIFSSIFSFYMEKRGSFHEGSFNPAYGYFYVLVLKTLSQGTALYCLVYFEHSCAEFLKPIKPMPKFWSIKLIVMATFWQSVTISILTSMKAMPWETIYSQCYANAAGGNALDRMTNPHHDDPGDSCLDDDMCYSGKYLAVFQTFGEIPCVASGDGTAGAEGDASAQGWNETVRELVRSSTGPYGLGMTVDELDRVCSQSCLSVEYCRNPLSKCHPWCQDFAEGFTDFFVFCKHSHAGRGMTSTFDFCARDEEHREKLVHSGLTEEEAEENVTSVCYSTYNDDVGDFEKFSEKSNIQLQNLLVCMEMFLAALAHRTVFSYRDFKSGTKKAMAAGLRDMIPTDALRDVRNLTGKTAKRHATNIVGEEAVDSLLNAVDIAENAVTAVADGVTEAVTEVTTEVRGAAVRASSSEPRPPPQGPLDDP